MELGEADKSTTRSKKPITRAIDILETHFQDVVTVKMWARKMGYDNPSGFSDKFRREFHKRPQPVLIAFRVRKAIRLLRQNQFSNYEVALKLKLRNEKGLYQFVKNQTKYAPSDIENLSKQEYRKLRERLNKKIIEQN